MPGPPPARGIPVTVMPEVWPCPMPEVLGSISMLLNNPSARSFSTACCKSRMLGTPAAAWACAHARAIIVEASGARSGLRCALVLLVLLLAAAAWVR